MKCSIIAGLGLLGLAIADCQMAYNACRSTGDPNEAQCSADLASCKATCGGSYNMCRTAADANMAVCASQYAGCLGQNPFASNGTNTIAPVAPYPGKPSITGTGIIAPEATGDGYTTEVVTAYTTYCPSATSFTLNGVPYTVLSSTTLTITDCPCTISHPISVAPYPTSNTTMPAGTGAAVYTSTTYCPSPTTFTYANSTYTVSSATILTLSSTANVYATPYTSAPAPAFTGAANSLNGALSGFFFGAMGLAMYV